LGQSILLGYYLVIFSLMRHPLRNEALKSKISAKLERICIDEYVLQESIFSLNLSWRDFSQEMDTLDRSSRSPEWKLSQFSVLIAMGINRFVSQFSALFLLLFPLRMGFRVIIDGHQHPTNRHQAS
jgi:hypothetical protein